MRKWIGFTTATLMLAGCGGGGADSNTNSPTPTEPTPTQLEVFGETSVSSGEAVEFAIATDTGTTLNDIQWQVDSDAITVLAGHTQVIGFDAPAAGDYPISVSASTSDGTLLEQSFVLSVAQQQAGPRVNIRVGREATEYGRVSLRAFVTPQQDAEITDITWEQIAGPSVIGLTFDDEGLRNNIYFQAPAVERDELLRFRATATFSDNSTASDTALVMVNNTSFDDEALSVYDRDADNIPDTLTVRMLPANPDSPYRNVLQDCVYSNSRTESCAFRRLPLIGQETESPSVNDIMDRTLVSHPWMADAFRDFLESSAAGDDILNLLRANTAVVISYDIRPSYYTAATASIYLDARYFWRTPEERDTLDNAPDFRSSFGNALQYTTFWRYVKDGEYYYPQSGTPVDERESRDIEAVTAGVVRLLYHELAHANDYFDYTIWSQLADSATPITTFNERFGDINSNALDETYPLTSEELHALAQVRYQGEAPTAEQQEYTAQMVANWFEQDTAVDHYAYSTIREDFAMLFERFMMLHRIGAAADEGTFTIETVQNEEYLLTYGNRNRVSSDKIVPRASFVVSRILPDLDIDAAIADFPEPQLLPAGADWFETVVLDDNESGAAAASERDMPEPDKALLKSMSQPRNAVIH